MMNVRLLNLRLLLAALLLCLAQFAAAQMTYSYYNYYSLTVTAQTGGTVTSMPAGIECPGMCSGSYTGGSVTLTASASAGYTFTGWSGDCSGTGACMLAMSDSHFVTAQFVSNTPQFTPQTGFWYNPAEAGRGFVIEMHSDNNLFIGGFMYDANGNAIWYASGPGAMASGTTYTGTWQQFGNGQTLTGAYQAPAVANNDVGSITLIFTSATAATLTLPDGRQIPLQRFPF
jgi:uncharacterized repeat protein (TIGR02543 family)